MLVAATLLPIILVIVQLQNSACVYKPSVREVNAIACVTYVLVDALLELDVSDKTKIDALRSAISKATDKIEASVTFRSAFKSENSKKARIRFECLDGGKSFSIGVSSREIGSISRFPSNAIVQCAKTTAEGLANIAFAVQILEPHCGKEPVVGPEEFMTSLWPAAATVIPHLPPSGYGEVRCDAISTQLALCYDDFRKSLNAKIDKCDKVVTSCDTAVNMVTKAKLSMICTMSGKTTEVTSTMLSACDYAGASQQGQNKHIVLEMFDRICEADVLLEAVAAETDPKHVENLFAEPLAADALVAVNRVDQALEPSPTLAKDVEEYFKKPECNCEGFRITDCDKDWPSGPLLRCENDKCTLDLTQLIEMNGQLPGSGKARASSGGSMPRRARLIWTARKILCAASQNGKTFKTEKGKIAAKISMMKSEFESALTKAAKNVKQ